MNVLGIETSTSVCSAAICRDDRVVAEYTLDLPAYHSERLVPMAVRLLSDCGIALDELDGVAVAGGPGSYTGLRIGMSTAKGLCLSLKIPLAAVSTLAAMALTVVRADEPVCAMLDARRGEVYAGVYTIGEAGLACPVADSAVHLDDLLGVLPRPLLIIGDGAEKYRSEIKASLGDDARFLCGRPCRPSAGSVALLGADRLLAGIHSDPASVEPQYLRRTQAERSRECCA